MLYPFFVSFADESKEELANSIVIAEDIQEAAAIANEAAEAYFEEGVIRTLAIEPFTLDFINSVRDPGVVVFEYVDEEENTGLVDRGSGSFGFFN